MTRSNGARGRGAVRPKTLPLEGWRHYRWRIILVLAACVALAVWVTASLGRRGEVSAYDRRMLEGYDSVGVSLARDDLPAAQESAAKLANDFSNWVTVAEPSRVLARSASLSEARRGFAELSKAAVLVARGRAGVFIFNDPANGSWVQTTETPESPYSGGGSGIGRSQ